MMTPLSHRMLLCALLLGLGACAPAYRVEVDEPGFTGQVTTRLGGNVLTSGSLLSNGSLELGLERLDRMDSVPRFAVLVQLLGETAPISSREPLLIFADGDTLSLAPDTVIPPRAEFQGVRIDRARYPAEPAQIRRLAAAKNARVSVAVGAGREERTVYARNLENLRRFVESQLLNDSALVPRMRSRPPVEPAARP
jgi:hypothetical protein